MELKSENSTDEQQRAYIPKIPRELYIQVEEKLNLRKALASRENVLTMKSLARSQWMGKQK